MEKNIVSLARENKLAVSIFIVASAFSFIFLSSPADATDYKSINSGCMVFVNSEDINDVMNAEWRSCYRGMPENAPKIGRMIKSPLSGVKSSNKIIRTGYEEGKVESKEDGDNHKYGAIYKDDKLGYRIGYRNEITKKDDNKAAIHRINKHTKQEPLIYIYVQKPLVEYYGVRGGTKNVKTSTNPQIIYVVSGNEKIFGKSPEGLDYYTHLTNRSIKAVNKKGYTPVNTVTTTTTTTTTVVEPVKQFIITTYNYYRS